MYSVAKFEGLCKRENATLLPHACRKSYQQWNITSRDYISNHLTICASGYICLPLSEYTEKSRSGVIFVENIK